MTIPVVGSPAAIGSPLRVFVGGHDGDRIGVLDRGLHYGDGLFETIRVSDGCLCQWARHLARLEAGLARLGFQLTDREQLRSEALAITDGFSDAVLKIIVTRGCGGRGYRPSSTPEPSTLLLLYPLPADDRLDWHDGIRARLCDSPASMNPALAGIKHLNRLDSVLARSEWSDGDIREGLMFDPAGDLVGGTMTNAFVWDGSILATPPVERSGIAGTVRSLVMELAAVLGIPCREQRLQRIDAFGAQAVFLTNSVAPLWIVRDLSGHRFDLSAAPWKLLELVRQEALKPG